jgi:hypothetical protein
LTNENKETFSANTETKGRRGKPNGRESPSNSKKGGLFANINNKLSNIGGKISSKVPRFKSRNIPINSNKKPKSKINNKEDSTLYNTKWNKDPKKVVEVDGKKVYGVGEDSKDKDAFLEKYGLKESDLNQDENKFIKLYSGDGSDILNDYLREVKGVWNPIKRLRIFRKHNNSWETHFKGEKDYMPMRKTIRVGKKLFKKGKILEEDIVVVRRQNTPLIEFADEGIYNNVAFLSTSISCEITKYGVEVSFIRIPKGERIVYIEGVTSAEGEFELILPPGIKLHLIEQVSKKLHTWSM